MRTIHQGINVLDAMTDFILKHHNTWRYISSADINIFKAHLILKER